MVPVLLGRARRLGVDVDDLVARRRIDSSASEVTISCEACRTLCDELADRANDERFGLHAALELPRGAYGLIEYVVRNTPSLRALVIQLVRFGRLINAQLDVTFDATRGRLEQRIKGEPECLGKQGNEFSLAHQVKVVREACGVDVAPTRVYFAHAAPPAFDEELSAYFKTREIVYSSGFNGVDLSTAALDTPLVGADTSLFALLEAQAARLVEQSEGDGLEPVRRAIARELETGEPTAKRVASALGLSERTLHRRIAEHDTSFGKLADRLRHKLALAYLEDSARSVTEVALLVGYSDGRAFARAFRRWTSTTPLEWRARAT